MIFVLATIRVHEQERAFFLRDAEAVIAATRNEPGCIRYDLTVDVADPLAFVFVERWHDRSALEAHFVAPHMAVWRKLCERYVADRRVDIITAADVETR